MNSDTGSVLDVLDAAYQLDQPVSPWLRGVGAALDRALGDGSGTIAVIADLSGPTRARFEHVEAIDVSWWQGQIELFEQMPVAAMRAFGAGPLFYFSQAAAALLRHDDETRALLERSALSRYGAPQLETLANARAGKRPDVVIERLVLTALSPFGRGLSALVPRREVAGRAPTRHEIAIWGRVAAHLAAAHRLRSGDRPVEAVLAPGGKLLDATGPAQDAVARDALRAAAIGQDRARSRRGRRLDPHEATEQWRAVISGRWSLVDQFERDGRRFLVARVNDRDAAPAAELTARETQVVELAALGHANKLIAYELGLSPATVARALARATHKLGATSRVGLIRRFLATRR